MCPGGQEPLKSNMLWLGSEPFPTNVAVQYSVIPPPASYIFSGFLLFKMAVFWHVVKFTYNEILILSVHLVSSNRSANTCVPQTFIKTYNIVTPEAIATVTQEISFPYLGTSYKGNYIYIYICIRLLQLSMFSLTVFLRK